MTFIRYFIPIIISGNKLGHRSTIFYEAKNKRGGTDRQCPTDSMEEFKNLSIEHNFDIKHTKDFDYKLDVLFTCAGFLLEKINFKDRKFKIFTIPFLLDANGDALRYTEITDKIIYFNEKETIDICIEHLKDKKNFPGTMNGCKALIKNSYKNLFLFRNYHFNRQDILEKYGIKNSDKIITYFLPSIRYREVDWNQIRYIFNLFKDYFFILKTRNKDEYSKELRKKFPKNSIYVNDIKWYPHPSLEFIFISNFIITTWNSNTGFEALELNKKVFIIKTPGKIEWSTETAKILDKKSPLCTLINNVKELDKFDLSNLKKPEDELKVENNEIFNFL